MVWVTRGKWVAIIHSPASRTPMPAMNRTAPGPWGRRETAMAASEHRTTRTAGTMWSTTSAVALVLIAGPLHWGSVAQKAIGRPTMGSSRARSGPGGATATTGPSLAADFCAGRPFFVAGVVRPFAI